MDDPLQDRTRRLVTDFLTFCAREPGVPESPPTSVEAELLRSLAARMQRQHEAFFSTFFGYQGNRVELVRQMADGVFSDSQNFNWGRLVLLLTFAGTLLNQHHSQATRQNTGPNNQTQVTRDCNLIVDLLCNWLLRHHRLWLEAHDGWVRPHAKRGRDGVWGWGAVGWGCCAKCLSETRSTSAVLCSPILCSSFTVFFFPKVKVSGSPGWTHYIASYNYGPACIPGALLTGYATVDGLMWCGCGHPRGGFEQARKTLFTEPRPQPKDFFLEALRRPLLNSSHKNPFRGD